MIDEGSRASRSPKATQIVGVRFDAGRRETRRNVRMTSGVLRDAVDQEHVGAGRAGSGPPQRAELHAVARSRCAKDAVSVCRCGATIRASVEMGEGRTPRPRPLK